MGSTEVASCDNFDPEVQSFFRDCSKQLDMKHDRHERLVKLSRDITIESKRVIFLLHRIHDEASSKKLTDEAQAKLELVVKNSWSQIARELQGNDPHHFLRAYSPGMQEYIEAKSFLYYIRNRSLIPLDQLQKELVFPNGSQVLIPVYEYLLGIADLTGELMRMCINAVGQGRTDIVTHTCMFLRNLHQALSSLNVGFQREFKRKLQVSKQSLQKVETACYAVQVRGSEVPKELLAEKAVLGDGNPTWNEEFE